VISNCGMQGKPSPAPRDLMLKFSFQGAIFRPLKLYVRMGRQKKPSEHSPGIRWTISGKLRKSPSPGRKTSRTGARNSSVGRNNSCPPPPYTTNRCHRPAPRRAISSVPPFPWLSFPVPASRRRGKAVFARARILPLSVFFRVDRQFLTRHREALLAGRNAALSRPCQAIP
jgi:hypothetical protein